MTHPALLGLLERWRFWNSKSMRLNFIIYFLSKAKFCLFFKDLANNLEFFLSNSIHGMVNPFTFVPALKESRIKNCRTVKTLSLKTQYAKEGKIDRKWHVIDAEGQVVGRLSSRVAHLLMGKHKTSFAPHMDCGDNVIIVNAAKVRFTGKKMDDKVYQTYSGYPGGQKLSSPKEILAKHPNRILEIAVRKMLPKSKLGDAMYRKLFVYEGADHPHAAQKPEPFTI